MQSKNKLLQSQVIDSRPHFIQVEIADFLQAKRAHHVKNFEKKVPKIPSKQMKSESFHQIWDSSGSKVRLKYLFWIVKMRKKLKNAKQAE